MAAYTNDLRLKEIGTGESSGTWGTETNTNLELIAEAFSFGTEAITTNEDTHTTTIADGSTDPGRSIYLKYTGTLDSACTITIGPNTVSKLWFIENGTSGSQNIIISQGSGANVTIPAGHVKAVYSDGAGSGAAIVDAFTNLNLGGTTTVDDLTISDDLTVTDDMTIGGTLGVTGIVTLTDDLIIGDGKTIGSASDVDAMTIASNGQVTFSQTLIGTALDISGDIDVDGTTNLDAVDIDGAVDMASTLAVGGVVTANAGVVVDNITIDGNEIDLSSGDLTIDVAGDIYLDAAGDDVHLSQDGTHFGKFKRNSSNLEIHALLSDGDTVFKGNDGGSTITALTLDMSDEGSAYFNNKLGVGTTSPRAILDLKNSGDGTLNTTASNYQILLEAPQGTGDYGRNIGWAVGSGTVNASINAVDAGASNATGLAFSTGAESGMAERMRLDASGMGLGTTSPATDLHISSATPTITFTDTDNNYDATIAGLSGSLVLKADANAEFGTETIQFHTGGSQRATIDSSGNLGLGTTSPDDELDVEGADPAIRLTDTSASGYARLFANNGSLLLQSDEGNSVSNSIIGFDVDGTERMRINSSGNVGIGTTSPSEPLHVNEGTGGVSTTLLLQNSSASVDGRGTNLTFKSSSTEIGQIQSKTSSDATSGILAFKTASSGTLSEQMRIDKDGNVGIGETSPSAPLDIAASSAGIELQTTDNTSFGYVNFGDPQDNNIGQILYDHDSNYMRFQTNNAERIRIHSGGQVTIGTTSTTIDSSNFGILLNGSNGRIKSAIDVGATGNVAQFFGNAGEFRIKGDGDVQNTNNSYTGISDQNLKENIVDATNKLDDINQVQIRNYNFIGSDHKQIGVIAQELESVFPSLVKTDDEGIKSVKYSIFVPILIKAVQEQQEQIESLKSEIANLKEK